MTAAQARRLVVFEINGVLLDRVHSSKASGAAQPDAVAGQYRFFWRPGLFDALASIGRVCDVALWTAGTRKNTIPLINLLESQTVPAFKFVWTREATMPDKHRRRRPAIPEDEWAVTKDLSLIEERFPQYNVEQILVVEDCPARCRRFADNIIIVPTYELNSAAGQADTVLTRLAAAVHDDALGPRPLFFA